MIGSGIYSTTETREIICFERCYDCIDIKKECSAIYNVDFETDDRGNIDEEITCKECGHSNTYTEAS